MAEFTPQELDALEDGLEALGDDADLATLDVPDVVRERLEDYQSILALTRDALPAEEPGPSVLTSVLAEARAATVDSVAPAQPSLWQRWRKSLVPVLALAGTTAAVLWIISPDAAREPDLPEMAAAERKDAGPDDAPLEAAGEKAAAASSTPIVEQSKAEEAEEDAVEAEPAPAQAVDEALEPKPALEVPDEKPKKKSKMAPGKGGGAVPGAMPQEEPAVAPADKDSLWSLVDSANRKRLAGTCGSAISIYRQVINGGQDDVARARAHAGIGLCLEYQGRAGEADAAFAEARKAAPGIDSWIVAQRQRMPDKGKNNKKSKPNAKKAAKKQSKDTMQAEGL